LGGAVLFFKKTALTYDTVLRNAAKCGFYFMNIYLIIPNNIADAKIYINGTAHIGGFSLFLLSF